MNIKEDILRMSKGQHRLDEMAAKELKMVADLISAGKAHEAAVKYFEVGGKRKGITRSVNTFMTKNPDMDKDKMKKFVAQISKVAVEQNITTKNKPKKTVVTKDGEETEAGGQSGAARKRTASERIEKEGEKVKKEVDILDSGNTEKIKALAKAILVDISEPPLSKDDRRDVKIIKGFIENGEKEDIAIDIMKDIVKGGAENLEAVYQHINRGSISPDEKTAAKKEQQYRDIMKKKKKE